MNRHRFGLATIVGAISSFAALAVCGCENGKPRDPVTASRAALVSSSPGITHFDDCNDTDGVPEICADPSHEAIAQANSLGYPYYVGHAEPTVKFFSDADSSASNMQWKLQLPGVDPAPTQNGSATANFQLLSATWIGLALCDPNSFPFGPCTAVSDANPTFSAGSAFLELQFYPPNTRPQCGAQWCAALHINTFQNSTTFWSNTCLEPTWSQLLTTTGDFHDAVFLMAPGDSIVATIFDTAAGLETDITDKTTNTTGKMIASIANQYQHNTTRNMNGVCSTTTTTTCTTNADCPIGEQCTCVTEPFAYHPEYATAKTGQFVPWLALHANVSFDTEIGHYELCTDQACTNLPDNADDGVCSVTPQRCTLNTDCPVGETCNPQSKGKNGVNCPVIAGVGGCFAEDLDQDGLSYQEDWPDGTANHPKSVAIGASNDKGFGPLSPVAGSYVQGYPTITFKTTEATGSAKFYPFYSQAGTGNACRFNFGDDIVGQTTDDFSKAAQYDDVSRNNPCFPGPVARCHDFTTSANASCQGTAVAANIDNGSSDPNGDPLTFSLSSSGPFPLGTTPVTLTVSNEVGATSTCTANVIVVDTTPPTLTPPPPVSEALCSLNIGVPTGSDNCASPPTFTGLVVSKNGAPLNPPIPVNNGQVTLSFGSYVVQWTASDGVNTSAPASQNVTSVDPESPYVNQLANGDMRYSVTFPAKQAYVEAFVRQNGVQNVAGNIVSSQVANGDGTFTYSRIVHASQYHAGDVISVRFYSYKANSPGVFTPGGATDSLWFPDFIYGSGDACPDACRPNFDELANGDVKVSITLATRQSYAEAFVRDNTTQVAAGNVASTGVANFDGTFTYSHTVPASNFRTGHSVTYRWYHYISGQPGVFAPGPTGSTWFPGFHYNQPPTSDCP
jgi:hypothetical protein